MRATLELCLYRTKDFCQKNNIPFYDEKVLGLINKAELLIDEIDPLPLFKTNRRFLTRNFKGNKTDEDLTEPKRGKAK